MELQLFSWLLKRKVQGYMGFAKLSEVSHCLFKIKGKAI